MALRLDVYMLKFMETGEMEGMEAYSNVAMSRRASHLYIPFPLDSVVSHISVSLPFGTCC